MNTTELFIKKENYGPDTARFSDTYLASSTFGLFLGLEFQTDITNQYSVGDIIFLDKDDKTINAWADGTQSILGFTVSTVFPAPGVLMFTDRPLQLPIVFSSNETGTIYKGSTISSSWEQLDLSDDVAFPITFNIADVREINNRNGAYSKTIVIPGTKENNKVFEYIFDIQGIDNYDTRVRVKANVLVDTIPVLEGYLQLDTINCDDNEYWTYNCIIYGENANFSKNIDQNALLNSLDFSEFDHYKTLDSITQSWPGDYTYGYFYPLLDYNNGRDPLNSFTTNQQDKNYINENFKPSIYVKQYWDKIFKLYGYTYESDFLNSDAFENLVIPTNVKNILNDDQWRYDSSFKAGIRTLAQSFVFLDTSIPVPSVENSIPLQSDYLDNWVMFDTGQFFYNPQATFVDIGGSFRYFNNYQGSVPKNQKIVLQLDYKITPIGNTGINGLGLLIFFDLYRNGAFLTRRKVRIFGGADTFFNAGIGNFFYQNNYDYVVNNFGEPDDYNATTSFQRRQAQIVYDTIVDGPISNGGNLEVRVGAAVFATNVNNGTDAINFTTTSYRIDFFPSTNGYDGCYFYNDIDKNLISSQPYPLSNSIPGNIKQIDFINSIIRMFNLYLSQDKVDPKKIYIEPRDQFYETSFVNWSRKLDISKDISHQPIVDRKKRVFMSYKEDKDLLNSFYKSQVNQIYGQLEYITGNQFDTSEQKVEVIFSPSPLSNRKLNNGVLDNRLIYTQILDPKSIVNAENYNNIESNIRILYRKNITLTNVVFRIFDFQSYYNFNTYPYAGHLDDPTNPVLDLSFSAPQFLFYERGGFGYPSGNLYNVYYDQFFEEIYGVDSKNITCYVYLTPQDIIDFDYRKLVYLDQLSSGSPGYFRVNKIEYDPFNKRSYKVELIKVLNNFKSQAQKIIDIAEQPVKQTIEVNDTITSGDPTTGKFIYDNVSQISSTQINISKIDDDSIDISGILNKLVVGNIISIVDFVNPFDFQTFEVSGAATIFSTYAEVPVILLNSGGAGTTNFPNNRKVKFDIIRETIKGEVGISLPRFNDGLTTVGNYNSGFSNIITGFGNSVRSDANIVTGNCNQILVGSTNVVSGYKNVVISENSGIISAGKSTMYGTGRYSNIIGGYSQSLSGRYSNIIGGCNNVILENAYNNQILGGCNNTIALNPTGTSSISQTTNSLILGGLGNVIEVGPTQSPTDNVFIIGGNNNTIVEGVTNSFIINGQNFLGSQSNTIYLEGNVLINGLAPSVSTPIPINELAFGDGSSIVSSPLFQVIPGTGTNTISNSSFRSSMIGGSSNNLDSTEQSSIIGGCLNKLYSISYNSTILGGYNNCLYTRSYNSSIVGGCNNKLHYYGKQSVVIGGAGNNLYNSINSSIIGGNNQYLYSSINSGIFGGYANRIQQSTNTSIISGGANCLYDSPYSTIIGGRENRLHNTSCFSSIISAYGATISGSECSVIIGGKGSGICNANTSSILTGRCNYMIDTCNSSIIGGYKNTIGFAGKGTVCNSVILGGQNLFLTDANAVLVENLLVNGRARLINISGGPIAINAGATITVSNLLVNSAYDRIFVQAVAPISVGDTFYVDNIVNGVSFDITHTNGAGSNTSIVYLIVGG